MLLIHSLDLSRLNTQFRERLTKHLITRYLKEHKIPDTWAEETPTITEELEIPAQLVISRLFGGWLDETVTLANLDIPIDFDNIRNYPHDIDGLCDQYSYETNEVKHRDFSGYMDQTAWDFMTVAIGYICEEPMLNSIFVYMCDIQADVVGALKALQGNGVIGAWTGSEFYEQSMWMGKNSIFAIEANDFDVEVTANWEGSPDNVVAKALHCSEYKFLRVKGKVIVPGYATHHIPTNEPVEVCVLNDAAIRAIEEDSR